MSGTNNTIYKTSFAAGTVLFREGEYGESAFLIKKGRVVVTLLRDDETVRLGSLGVGELVGEMALVDEGLRSATVTAVSDLEVMVLTKPLVESFLEDSNPALRLFLRVILDRFRRLQQSFTPASGQSPHNIKASKQIKGVRKQALEELDLVSELYEALEKKEFQLVYQPIISLGDGSAAGFEALIRWNHPIRGVVSPLEFISISERSGQIVPIGHWILLEAFLAHKRFQEVFTATKIKSRQLLFTSINLSARQLEDENLLELITALVEEVGVDPAEIKLEITESFLMSDPEAAREVLHKLKVLGFSIAIDDFGTGFSSLSSLHSFPIHTIKIDQAFVKDMSQNPVVKKVIKAIVGLARELDMDTVAEGIEEEKDLSILRDMGSSYGQGFFISKPLPFDGAIEFLEQHKGW